MKRYSRQLVKIIATVTVFMLVSSITVHTFAAVKISSPKVDYRAKLHYNISDAVIDPNSPYIYTTDVVNKKVHRINYETGKTSSISFKLKPERMVIYKGMLYVTLLKQEYSSYRNPEDERGAIGVIDLKSFSLKEQFDVASDPYDIAISRDGYIYISSGSGQHTSLKSYSLSTKLENHSAGIDDASFIEMHPKMNKIYSYSSNVSPIDGYAYNISDGKFTKKGGPIGYDSPYHGDYQMLSQFTLSPDGQYIFNYAGTVFGCGAADDYDMSYITKLNSLFTAIAFNTKDNYFYTAVKDRKIDIYDQLTLEKVSSLQAQGDSHYLFYRYSKLISVSKHGSGFYFIEILRVPSLSRDKGSQGDQRYLPYNANISDTEIDPVKPVMYLADAANSKVHGINYKDFSTWEVKLDFPPERMVLANGKLYVTMLKMTHNAYINSEDQQGAIGIIDVQNKKLINQWNVDITPYDIAVDQKGYIYVSSSSGQWTNLKMYLEKTGQEVSASRIYHQSAIAYNNKLNKIYTIQRMTPTGIVSYQVKDDRLAAVERNFVSYKYFLYIRKVNISPDGKYLFNETGAVLKCSDIKNEDMKVVKVLNKGFQEITFDLDQKRFYTAQAKNMIYAYNYDSFEGIGTYTSEGTIKFLHYQEGNLIVLSKLQNKGYSIEKIKV